MRFVVAGTMACGIGAVSVMSTPGYLGVKAIRGPFSRRCRAARRCHGINAFEWRCSRELTMRASRGQAVARRRAAKDAQDADRQNAAAMIDLATRPLDTAAMDAARARQGQLVKPPGSLGRLEELAIWLAGVTGEERPQVNARVVVAAADHGVSGVSRLPARGHRADAGHVPVGRRRGVRAGPRDRRRAGVRRRRRRRRHARPRRRPQRPASPARDLTKEPALCRRRCHTRDRARPHARRHRPQATVSPCSSAARWASATRRPPPVSPAGSPMVTPTRMTGPGTGLDAGRRAAQGRCRSPTRCSSTHRTTRSTRWRRSAAARSPS